MIPLRDNIPSRITPLVTYTILAVCSLVFLAQLSGGDGGQRLAEQYGMVPLRISDPGAPAVVQQQVAIPADGGYRIGVVERSLAAPAVAPWLTVITCMFLHGGWLHFLGNMWFLYIFGDNVEDRFGHFGFAVLYLATGIVAGLAHFVSAPGSTIPTIGASGAIAGVMGAYAWLYPHARVQAVIPLFVIMPIFVVPAPIFLGVWFIIQMFSGVMSTASAEAGGVAWWAHIGGFVAGGVAAMLVRRTPLGNTPVAQRRF